jgi:phage gpG-like protein
MVKVGTNISYAPIIEYGDSKRPARPFLFPAFNGNKQKILKELAKALKGGVGL